MFMQKKDSINNRTSIPNSSKQAERRLIYYANIPSLHLIIYLGSQAKYLSFLIILVSFGKVTCQCQMTLMKTECLDIFVICSPISKCLLVITSTRKQMNELVCHSSAEVPRTARGHCKGTGAHIGKHLRWGSPKAASWESPSIHFSNSRRQHLNQAGMPRAP